MKLALDVWYEAWGRTADRDVVGAAGQGEAVGAPEEGVRDVARGDRGGHRPRETAGDANLSPCAAP